MGSGMINSQTPKYTFLNTNLEIKAIIPSITAVQATKMHFLTRLQNLQIYLKVKTMVQMACIKYMAMFQFQGNLLTLVE